ncbi:Thioredoxin like [Melia azedarach]|uniref:Thioredoxin like n=1 Tax=Melia azedarach TaxID=155640 RepID=A0ACC1YAZ2_MELAZ|nr:Thioredoxin like [Melia azedarach]
MGHCWTKCCRHNADDEFDDQQVELAGGNVQLITTMASWEAKISESIKDHKIVVANFSAQWCSPCKKIAAAYAELSDKYPSIICLTVDVDELPEFSTSWGIKATPTFFFLKDGREVDKLIGANKVELHKKTAAVFTYSNSSPTQT